MFQSTRTDQGWWGWDDECPGAGHVVRPDIGEARKEIERRVEGERREKERREREEQSAAVTAEAAIYNVRRHYISIWRETAHNIAEEVPERLADYLRPRRKQRRWLRAVLGVRNLKRALTCCGPDAERTLYAVLGELSNPEDVRGYASATHREAAIYWAIDEHINELERLIQSLEIVSTLMPEEVPPHLLLTQIRLIMRRRAGAFVSGRRPIQFQKIGTRGPAATPAGARKGYLMYRLDELLPRDYRERGALIAALMCAAGIPTERQHVTATLKDRKRKD